MAKLAKKSLNPVVCLYKSTGKQLVNALNIKPMLIKLSTVENYYVNPLLNFKLTLNRRLNFIDF
ncbi:hypothetical protein HYN43_005050 [Mucilaginibacter celer]|uniref:Uncharacterized protein n=1 Tax=Mucilaginibacter celer TaxID=2305508 RepID=A0A494VM47_9SPHI|nr:hypothetical protein HYN43_005050 [Mucilaginibacter celer]